MDGPFERAFLAAGNARAEKVNVLRGELSCSGAAYR